MVKRTFVEPEMVNIPAGSFEMGSNSSVDEKPVHTVVIAKPFSIAKHLVTFDQYDLFSKASKSQLLYDEGWGRRQRPVINVSWEEAIEYACWISDLTGKSYRLLSEAEWEYAIRAGSDHTYFWGDQDLLPWINSGDIRNYAWFKDNSNGKTHPVGGKLPNAFGLYDMSGNVWEWVQDCWHENYQGAPLDGKAWQEQNNSVYASRMLRGGSWIEKSDSLRSAIRYKFPQDQSSYFIGFRLAHN